MSTVEFITALFYEVDEQLRTIPKHPEAHLWPSEVVTLGLLHALKGVGNRAFYRWLTRGSCTPNLRIIPIAQKPDTMVSFPHHVRRLCHDPTPLLLSTGDPGPGVVVRHAAPPLADP